MHVVNAISHACSSAFAIAKYLVQEFEEIIYKSTGRLKYCVNFLDHSSSNRRTRYFWQIKIRTLA